MTWKVNHRVKRVRRGCTPNYGTVIELVEPRAGPDDSDEKFVRVKWDHGPSCLVGSSELTLVVRDRKRA